MSQTAAIIARMGMDSGEYRKDLQKVVKENERAQQKMAQDAERAAKQASDAQKRAHEEQISRIRGAASEMASVVGISAGVGGILAMGQQALDFAGQLSDMSDAIGINVEALQELDHAFGQSGASSEVVTKGLVKLSENLVAARNGDEKLIASFKALGVTWEDINKMSLDEIIMKVAASSGSAANAASRLSLIIDTFGKSGAKMAAGLNGGAEALKELREEASKWTKDQVGDLDRAGDAVARFQRKVINATGQGILLSEKISEEFDAKNAKKMADSITPIGGMSENDRKPPERKGGPWDEFGMTEKQWNAGLPKRSGPLDPKTSAQFEEQAKAAMDLLRAETANTQILADKEADATQKKSDDELAAIAEGKKAQQKAVSDIADQQAKAAMDGITQDLANAQELADREADIAAEKKETAKKDAEDIREFEREQYSDWLGEKSKLDKEAAKSEEKKIEGLASLRKQRAQEAAAALNQRAQDIADPAGAAGRRRQGRRNDSLMRRAQREQDLENRGGRSQRDIDDATQDPLKDQLKPKENFGPNETLPEREARLRKIRGEQAKEALARGRKGADQAGNDFKSALNDCTIATDIAEIKGNLRGAKL